jgi:hypothetical protein
VAHSFHLQTPCEEVHLRVCESGIRVHYQECVVRARASAVPPYAAAVCLLPLLLCWQAAFEVGRVFCTGLLRRVSALVAGVSPSRDLQCRVA